MTDNAPERIRVEQDAEGFWTCREAVSGSQEYVRADIYEAALRPIDPKAEVEPVTDKAFLRDLAVRLQKIPVCMGVDDHDIDRLIDLARSQSAPAENASGESEAVRIADAVLAWMVKYDLLDGGNEYRAEDVIAVMNDFAPAEKAGVGDAQDELARLRAIALDMQSGYIAATERADEAVKAANALQTEVDLLRAALSTTKPAQGDGRLASELNAAASLLETLAEDLPEDDVSAVMMRVMAQRNRAALAAQGDDAQEGTR